MKTNSKKIVLAGLALAVCGSQAFAVSYTLTPNVGTTPGPSTLIPNAVGTVNPLDENAIFTAVNPTPTSGTGVIAPFLRLGAQNNETGYNTSGRGGVDNPPGQAPNDALSDPNFTRDLPLSAVPIVTIGGVEYFQFYLDLNEPNGGAGPAITLNLFNVGTGAAGQTTDGAPVMSTFYSLGANNTLGITDVNQGSGVYDVTINVPRSAYTGSLNQNLILYAGFTGSGATFEEFGTFGVATTVPDGGATVMLLGVGLVALGAGRRFRKL